MAEPIRRVLEIGRKFSLKTVRILSCATVFIRADAFGCKVRVRGGARQVQSKRHILRIRTSKNIELGAPAAKQAAEKVDSERVLVAQPLLAVRVLQLQLKRWRMCGLLNRTAKSGCATRLLPQPAKPYRFRIRYATALGIYQASSSDPCHTPE